jgi:Mrp family chromosome partitioning ATPase
MLEMGKIDTTLARMAGTSAASPQSLSASAAKIRRRQAELPDLGQYPELSIDARTLEKNRIIGFGSDGTKALSAYRMIRTRLLQSMRSYKWRTIAISSAGMGEGKSLTSINLALSISREGNQNVFLVDLDMRRPSIKRYLGVDPAHGVQDYFEEACEASDIFFRIGPPGLAIAVATDSRDASSELLASDRLPQLIDYVFAVDPNAVLLFDMPPLLLADDVLAVAPRVDGLLLVATEGKTKRHDLATAAELVTQFGLAGIVLNKSSETVAHYY